MQNQLHPDTSGAESDKPDRLQIDPVKMGITNRIASGCTCVGHHQYQGGLLVQGSLGGHIQINGDLVLWAGGMLEGHIELTGDLYLFGQLGKEEVPRDATTVSVRGTVFAAHTCISFGTIYGKHLQTYDGAQLFGPFMTNISQNELFDEEEGVLQYQPS